MTRGIGLFVFVLTLLPSAFLAWQNRELPQLGSFHDDAIYVASARDFAAGEPYRISSLPWTPAQTKYPPLYPLYLSLAWRLAPAHPEPVALLLNWLWLPILALGAFQLLRQNTIPHSHALAVGLILPLHPTVILASLRLMSDLMFAALAIWSLVLVQHRGGAFVAGLAFLTRTAGLPLCLAIIAFDARARRWRRCMESLATSAIFILGWQFWSRMHAVPAHSALEKYYTDYVGYQLEVVPLAQIPAHLASQCLYLFAAITRSLLAIFGDGFVSLFLGLFFCLLSLVGITMLMRNGKLIGYGIYGVFALPLLAAWYYRIDDRALLPVLPLLLAGLTTGLVALAENLAASWRRKGLDAALAVCFGLILVSFPIFALRHSTQTLWHDAVDIPAQMRLSNQSAQPAYDWIRQNTDPETTFYAINDTELFLRTGRRAIRLPIIESTFERTASGLLKPAGETLDAMRSHRIHCLFASSKQLNPPQAGTAPQLDVDFASTGLAIQYRSRTELVACLTTSHLRPGKTTRTSDTPPMPSAQNRSELDPQRLFHAYLPETNGLRCYFQVACSRTNFRL
jgi:hypothetical protein